ncbi:MAG: hypothetical protein H0T58_02925 [Gemmatimonadales bacterium]|nr:hypothetical protein [Gemmatimonadales bacterium]
MTKADFEVLKKAVEDLHDCEASFLSTEHVRESFDGKPVWDGGVSLFALTGHPAATICYAWSAEAPGSSHVTFYAVLHLAPVESSRDAVRASLALRSRAANSAAMTG